MDARHQLVFRRKRNRCPKRTGKVPVTKKTAHTYSLQADQRVVPRARAVDDPLRGARDKRSERAHIRFIV